MSVSFWPFVVLAMLLVKHLVGQRPRRFPYHSGLIIKLENRALSKSVRSLTQREPSSRSFFVRGPINRSNVVLLLAEFQSVQDETQTEVRCNGFAKGM
jgi:hypothetical protein